MSDSEANPYAAPADLSAAPGIPDVALYFRDGNFLAVRNGAELPSVCMITNEAADSNAWRKKVSIAWTPPWVFITIFINIIVLLIVALLFQKKAKITYSLSRAARGRIVRKRRIGFVLLTMAIALVALAFMEISNGNSDMSALAIGSMSIVALIASLIVFAISNPVKVVKCRKGWFRIKGCSKEFLAGLPEYTTPF